MALGGAIVRAGFVIRDEMRVSQAEQRLERQPDFTVGEAPDVGVALVPANDPPARALVAEATFLARHSVATVSAKERRDDLDRAAARIAAAVEARPHWGEAWTVRAFVESLRFGADDPAVRAAFRRSYRDAPFLRSAGAWRVRYGLDQWRRIDGETRGYVVQEAVWLMRIDGGLREPIFTLARASPGYAPLLLRWRALRAGDPDFVTGERARP